MVTVVKSLDDVSKSSEGKKSVEGVPFSSQTMLVSSVEERDTAQSLVAVPVHCKTQVMPLRTLSGVVKIDVWEKSTFGGATSLLGCTAVDLSELGVNEKPTVYTDVALVDGKTDVAPMKLSVSLELVELIE